MIENTKKEIEALHKHSERIPKEIVLLEKISREPNEKELIRESAKEDIKKHNETLAEIASEIRGLRNKLRELQNHRLIECGR